MTGYEMVLLARAVEACNVIEIDDLKTERLVTVRTYRPDIEAFGGTIADALTAFLRTLGVEVPEPPSAERVAEAETDTAVEDPHGDLFYALSDLRDLYAREPQTVIALLEGGAS